MPVKTTTQKLDIRWQDRAWQPRIRRTPSGATRSVERLMVPHMNLAKPAAAERPCRRGMAARLVRHVILAFRPRRRK